MKTVTSAYALAAALFLIPVAASADSTPGWYAGAGVGMNFAEDAYGHSPDGTRNMSFDVPGLSANGSGGYTWNNGWRAEGEVFYDNAVIDKISGANGGNGHLSNLAVFANGLYDFKTGTMFTPYLGAGVGMAFITAKNIGPQANGANVNQSDNLRLAYQGIAGVSAQLDHNWAVTADYRYVTAMDPRMNLTSGGSSRTNDSQHNVMFGMRYSFGQPEPVQQVSQVVPPQPMPQPAPAIVAPPTQANYVVFFDFNKTTLTPEAQRILASAAEDYKRSGYVRVMVTGNTDTVGSARYNDKLSAKRAEVVKGELVRLGVDPNAVVAKGQGKASPMVSTPDNVREAHNRRAEIVMSR